MARAPLTLSSPLPSYSQSKIILSSSTALSLWSLDFESMKEPSTQVFKPSQLQALTASSPHSFKPPQFQALTASKPKSNCSCPKIILYQTQNKADQIKPNTNYSTHSESLASSLKRFTHSSQTSSEAVRA